MPKHQFGPVIDSDSQILILGSFPSVESRKQGFYYAHPQNRFYHVLSAIYHEDFVSISIEAKKALLKKHHIALYDVVESCQIQGSQDQSIQPLQFADIDALIKNTKIKHLYLNGAKAYDLFQKAFPHLLHMATKLPSTSSANARFSLEKLILVWTILQK